ncbi:TPA: threonylcarbamoyl-AMP synthase, partial [bacterium]|nr:threonylcarbamoyl-AMP synthase [bacterium]
MTKILKSNTVGIKEAAEILRCGGLVAFPTETVYGLGANGLSETAVKLIFKAKNRPDNNPLILHVSSLEMASEVAYEIPVIGKKLLEKFWPGPLTLVVKKSDKVPVNVSAGGKTVALRMPDHPIALSLIKEAGFPIAAPSANISGKPSPIEAGDVLSDLDGKIDAVIDGGKCRVGLESTVVDVTQNKVKILRHGAISLEQLAELLDYKP